MFLFKITKEEVKIVTSNLDDKPSSGEDFVNNLLVKMSPPEAFEYITFFLNFLFNRCEFPQELKKVFPLHKSDPKLAENNYRPISLFIAGSKNYEKNLLCLIGYTLTLKDSLLY